MFTSALLTEDMEITGPVEAVIWVSSSGRSADWTARLCEVDDGGRSIGLVDGIFRQQVSRETPQEVTIRLGHISHLCRRGTRLRLQIASSNFPRFDRNPQSGAPSTSAREADFVVAEHVVRGAPVLQSRLVLPVIPHECQNQ